MRFLGSLSRKENVQQQMPRYIKTPTYLCFVSLMVSFVCGQIIPKKGSANETPSLITSQEPEQNNLEHIQTSNKLEFYQKQAQILEKKSDIHNAIFYYYLAGNISHKKDLLDVFFGKNHSDVNVTYDLKSGILEKDKIRILAIANSDQHAASNQNSPTISDRDVLILIKNSTRYLCTFLGGTASFPIMEIKVADYNFDGIYDFAVVLSNGRQADYAIYLINKRNELIEIKNTDTALTSNLEIDYQNKILTSRWFSPGGMISTSCRIVGDRIVEIRN
jgi:hypothetical protein